jgi:hypothetical protein
MEFLQFPTYNIFTDMPAWIWHMVSWDNGQVEGKALRCTTAVGFGIYGTAVIIRVMG